MSSQFRPTRPEDAAAISRFMQQVFGMSPQHPGLDGRQMDWKYWRTHPHWEGSRGYVMERDGQIAAHGSVVPLVCRWGERQLRMVDLIDWAAHPGNPGVGITLLKRIAPMVDGVFIAGGTDAAQKVFGSLGFRESPSAIKFALPLRPLRRFLRHTEPWWKRVLRVARNSQWMLRGQAVPPAIWSARRLSAPEIAGASFPMPQPRAEAAVFERTAADIQFLLECPITPGEFFLVTRNNLACGYFVLNLVGNQCRIGEAWVEPGGSEDWLALYGLAAQQARCHRRITEIATVATGDDAAQKGLLGAGFRVRGSVPLRLLIREAGYPPNIRYQLVDNDSAFMNHGTDTHWS